MARDRDQPDESTCVVVVVVVVLVSDCSMQSCCRLGPCEEPLWGGGVKMSAVTGGITKKRKKADSKPQTSM